MRFIDFHVHINRPEHWTPIVHEFVKRLNEKMYDLSQQIMEPQLLAHYLSEQGVEAAVLLAQVTPAVGLHVPNDYVAEFCRGHENLIPFASVNPNVASDPVRELERAVKDLGCRGLKLYPPYEYYYPNDPLVYPLYAKAQEIRIPVMIHTGSSVFPGSRLKYGDPIFLDDVAVDFPDLDLLIVHGGRGFWYDRAFFLAQIHSRVYLEISGLPPQRLLQYFPNLERIAHKVIFGSDWPSAQGGGIRANAEAVAALPLKSETIEGILYHNARRLLFDRP